MEQAVRDLIRNTKLGTPQVHKNMTVIPIISSDTGPDYLTMSEAMAQEVLVVSEIDKGGSVPELKVQNNANKSVLLIDGEEVAGAKQNRVLNTTILLAKKSETFIPVSCTEQGRWNYDTDVFFDSDIIMHKTARAKKNVSVRASLRQSQSYASDQGQVWDDIAELHEDAGTQSGSGAMRDMYEQRKVDLDDYVTAFEPVENQSGMIAIVNGKVEGADVVSRRKAYNRLHDKVIRSYAVDATLRKRQRQSKPEDPNALVTAFIKKIQDCEEDKFKSTGQGWDLRYKGAGIVGSALSYRDTVIHTAFFSVDEEAASGDGERMSDVNRRRRYRQ